MNILAVLGSTKSGFTGGLATIKNNEPTTINGKVIIIPDEIAFRCLWLPTFTPIGDNILSNFSSNVFEFI